MTDRRRPQRTGGQRSGARRAVDPARSAALAVLRAVRVEDGYANLVLPAVIRDRGLDARDAGFVTELASGTLRRRGTYDAILAACIDRNLRKVEVNVLDVLRLGVHQLLSMRVPTHAAISTSVDLARAVSGQGAGGFCNAVLRKVAQRDLEEWLDLVAGPDLPRTERAAIRHSHPVWVVDELHRAAPEADLDELLAADNVPPQVTLVARPGQATQDELPGAPTRFSPYGVVSSGGDPAAIPAVAEGRAGAQDEGSQLVSIALADAPLEGRDARWLDMCAGPGGKSALLAALAAQRGAGLVATEQHLHRARLVARAASGAGLTGVLQADGTAPPFRAGSFDRILVDAPCSGLGALRRRPEARWRRKPEDLTVLVELQRRLLASALTLVRPGGIVLYATCSPVRAETEDVVRAVLDDHDHDPEHDHEHDHASAVVEDVSTGLPAIADAAGPLPGTMQLWPHRHGTDAMFMALLRRSAS